MARCVPRGTECHRRGFQDHRRDGVRAKNDDPHRGGESEGRGRQDDHCDQPRHGARGDRLARAAGRPRSAGQCLDRARDRPLAARAFQLRRADRQRHRWPKRRSRRACRGWICCRRRSICPAPRSRWSASRIARTGSTRRSTPAPAAVGHLPDRLSAVARPADRQCAGRGAASCWCRCNASSSRWKGLSQLLQTVERIRAAFNPELSILGIALTMFDRRNNLSQAVAEDVRACLGSGGVRDGRAAQRAPVRSAKPRPAGVDLRPSKCPGSEAYMRLARELIGRLPQRGGGGMSAIGRRKGSGMGLSALLGEARAARSATQRRASRGGVREIEIARIRPNPESAAHPVQRRSDRRAGGIHRERGVLQPILLRPRRRGASRSSPASGAGARRSGRGCTRIPAIVRDIDEATTAELALIENIQREDLNAIEEAEGYRQLIERHGHTQDGVGEDRSQVPQPCRQPVEIARTSRVRDANRY